MMNTNKLILSRGVLALGLGSLLLLSSCTKDLDRFPTNGDTSNRVFSSVENTTKAFAKVYGAFALTGNGDRDDIQNVDAGESDFVRGLFNLQELPTDMAKCAWGDAGVGDMQTGTWSPSNKFLRAAYYRSIFQIKLASNFLRETASQADNATIRRYRAEARFLRAYQWWVLLDLFGRPAFIDENTPTGNVYPRQISRTELFGYVESELRAIEPDLAAPGGAGYARADQAAAWALLSRLYLNAEVYTGTQRYADAATYAERVINSGRYSLRPTYSQLFLADNDRSNPEVLLAISYDGVRSQSWGGTTFLINAATGGDAKAATGIDMGVQGGWQGYRATLALPELFGGESTRDTRYLGKVSGTGVISDLTNFTQGVYVYKWRNVTSSGANGSNRDLADTDFPLLRLAELYLNYAEAAVRGYADQARGLAYLNLVRARAYGNASGNYSALPNLNEILAERGREFYWEGQRRTDLIRFGRFTSGDYLWPWKGGVAAGKALESHRSVYPLPAADLQANPENLTQNPGY